MRWDLEMSRPTCQYCGDQLVVPAGPLDAEILLLGEFPGYNEIVRGYPFVSDNRKGPTAGFILETELARIGLQMIACRATNLWQHKKDETHCHFDWHKNTAAKEIIDRKVVLTMGSDTSLAFFNQKVMDLSGTIQKHDAYPDTRFVIAPNPASVLHTPVGEFRHAIEVMESIL